ncbi:MAG: 50S ribosomal protein L18 [Candidatus Dojkabacteria bacterium]|nr:50S ribosomal protein L18 [Candidatus Dojkabacteria bacterium]
MSNLRLEKRVKRHLRVRKKLFGTPERPRVSVYKSNKNFQVQLVIDSKVGASRTLFGLTTSILRDKSTKKEKIDELAKIFVEKAKKKNIEKIVFDRGGYAYKGNVKFLAEKLREYGLNF